LLPQIIDIMPIFNLLTDWTFDYGLTLVITFGSPTKTAGNKLHWATDDVP